ncbi:MAG: DNA recombination protein RmuC [Alistipes sp.]|nr:DNA recombination protein RmuC [Alistipes sp.]
METIILAAALALIAGIVAGYLFGKRGVTQAEQRVAALQEQILALSQLKAALDREVAILKEQLEEQSLRAAAEIAQLKEEHQSRLAEQEQRFKDAEATRRAEYKQQTEQQLETIKAQLKQQTEQTNRESITEILKPYREQLEQIRQQGIEDRATLQSEIKRFVETGGRLTREADRLVTALSGSVTIQGNLGEKLLADLLAGSGLIEGVQYTLQKTVRNDDGTTAKNASGKKMRPDAALIYPETNSILYIDSKFQLPSELDFDNLEAENQRAVMKIFAEKITDQARKLSDRNYDRSNNEGYIPLPYVIMFVPSEAALTAVTSFDKTLWQRIFTDFGVCLASERNLLVLIEMVRYMWQRQVTISNYEDIIAKAETVLDRVTDFMSHFSAVEKSLQAATEATEKMRKLSAERGSSIAVAVHNLASLGVKPHKVSNNDRPKRLKEHLKNIATDDTAEE